MWREMILVPAVIVGKQPRRANTSVSLSMRTRAHPSCVRGRQTTLPQPERIAAPPFAVSPSLCILVVVDFRHSACRQALFTMHTSGQQPQGGKRQVILCPAGTFNRYISARALMYLPAL